MSFLNNLKISTKLISGFVIIALIAGIVGLVGYMGIMKVKGFQDEIAVVKLPSVYNAMQIAIKLNEIKAQEFGIINRKITDVKEREHFHTRIAESFKFIEDAWKQYETLPQTDKEAKLWKEFVPAFNEWKKTDASIVEASKEKNSLLESGKAPESEEVKAIDEKLFSLVNDSRALFKIHEKLLKEIVEDNLADAKEDDIKADASVESTLTMLILIIAIAMILAILIGLFLARLISKPINSTMTVANSIADGDMRVQLDSNRKDETGSLMAAMQRMADNIQLMVAETNELSAAAMAGKLDKRADSSKYKGEFKSLVDGFNAAIGSVVNMIDKLPIPIMIIDKDFGINYMNDFGCSLDNRTKENIIQTKCYDYFKTSHCNTKDCACSMAMNLNRAVAQETDAHPGNNNLEIKYFGFPLKDVNGNIIGAFEGVIDQTEIKKAQKIAQKVADYQDIETKKLSENIIRLGNGDTNITPQSEIADNDTNDSKNKFDNIYFSLIQCAEAINSLVNDSIELANAGTQGRLNVRGDESKHFGDYKKIINGFNNSLESVVSTINSSASIMIADSNMIINFVSTATYRLFKSYETRIKAVFPNFDPDNIIGHSIDFYHKNPSHQRNMLSNLSSTHKTQITFGDVIFNLSVTPLIDKKGNKNGYAVEWIDVTNEANFNNELNVIVDDMTNGNLSNRMELVKLAGQYKDTAKNINSMLDVIMKPINEALDVLKLMSEGDLTAQVQGDFKGDHALLKNILNETIDSIGDILGQVKVTVEEVTRGAMQVSDASTALSQGATESAASLEEITSSMAEIGSQTKLNAENANTANYLTLEARNAAEKGNTEMQQLNNAMSEITESSKNISKIIKVIDEIAFQTNLLALNAAVEAARAGRHGKGFAVVAEEVRNLAARSASAAKETAEMIENSIRTVDKGSNLAGKTAEALETIKSGAVKASDIVGEIATSSNEQAQGISQINEGLNQIDKVTQTNTASAEESASAAEELSGQANQLRIMLSRFKIKGGDSSMGMGSYGQHPTISNRMINSSPSKKLPSANYDAPKSRPQDIINLEDDDFGRY
jgi:methyl-accepting chemotaxis protein